MGVAWHRVQVKDSWSAQETWVIKMLKCHVGSCRLLHWLHPDVIRSDSCTTNNIATPCLFHRPPPRFHVHRVRRPNMTLCNKVTEPHYPSLGGSHLQMVGVWTQQKPSAMLKHLPRGARLLFICCRGSYQHLGPSVESRREKLQGRWKTPVGMTRCKHCMMNELGRFQGGILSFVKHWSRVKNDEYWVKCAQP